MKFKSLLCSLVLTFYVTLLMAQYQDDIIEGPFFEIQGDNGLEKFPLLGTEVKATITGVIADVIVKQKYVNNGNRPIEATYVFPASTRSAIYHMEMKIGNRILKAKVEEKNKARKIYEAAKTEGKRASLLVQHKPNVFQMAVANIMPGDYIEIDLRYTELLIPTDQEYEFVYPTVVAPRFIGEKKGVPEPAFASLHTSNSLVHSASTFDIQVALNMAIPIQEVASKSHKINIRKKTKNNFNILLDESIKGSEKDFILNYSLNDEEIQSGVMTYEGKDENFFLVQIEPPAVAAAPNLSPREYIFVLDVSGSMKGYPLEISKGLMSDLLAGMNEHDRFNIMYFAGSSYTLSEKSIPATSQNKHWAFEQIKNAKGGNGTYMLQALENALKVPRAPSMSRSFVIVTDGFVNVEEEVFPLISSELGEANFFAFGIGNSVNRHMIEGIARAGKAEPFIVTNHEDAKHAAIKLKKYIEYPVLTDICLSYNGMDVYDLQPMNVPDLMAARPLFVFGKYRNCDSGEITISGMSGDNVFREKIDLTSNQNRAEDSKALSYLWAREKIRNLGDLNIRKIDTNRINEITALGLQYNLLTKYTSFVAVDEMPVHANVSATSSPNSSSPKLSSPKPSSPKPPVNQAHKQPQTQPQNQIVYAPTNAHAIGFEMELESLVVGSELASMLVVDVQADEVSTKIFVDAILESFFNEMSKEVLIKYFSSNQLKINVVDNHLNIQFANHVPAEIEAQLFNLFVKVSGQELITELVKVDISVNSISTK